MTAEFVTFLSRFGIMPSGRKTNEPVTDLPRSFDVFDDAQ
jgi:hypothetical protein